MMKNHDIAKLVNDLTAIAKQYGQTEQLRDRVADAVQGLTAEVEQLHKELADADAALTLAATKKPDLYVAFSECGQFIRFWTRSKIEMQCQKLAMPDTIHEFYAAPALPAPALRWISADEAKPGLSDDVIVTILIDGIDTDWKAGYWDGLQWYLLDTEHDEPIQVNAGCNFVVTHWARVVPAGLAEKPFC